MRALAVARVLGLLWLIPLEIVAIAVYRSGTFSVETGYAPAEQALGSESFILCIPLIALAASISANKLQLSGFLDRPSDRPAVQVFGLPLIGIFLPSAAIAAAAQLLSIRNSSAFHVNIGLLITPMVWAAAAALFGWCIGSRVSLKFAAPISVLLPYIFVGFPPAMDPAWIQHTIGMSTLCCSVNEVPTWRPPVAAVLLAGGAALPLWIALTRRFTRSSSLFAIVGLFVAASMASLSAATAFPLGYQATASRDARERSCKDFGVEVCYWPEHSSEIESAEPEIRKVLTIARDQHLIVPDTLIEAPEDEVTWPSAPLVIHEADSPSTVLWAIASSIMPVPSMSCQDRMPTSGTGKSSLTYESGSEALSARLSELAGKPIPPEMLSPEVPRIVKSLRNDEDGGLSRLREAQELISACKFNRAVL